MPGMNTNLAHLAKIDPVWDEIRKGASDMIQREPILSGLMQASILSRKSFEDALCYRLAQKLASREMSDSLLREIMLQAHEDDPDLALAARADIEATHERDPASRFLVEPLMFFKGYQAVQVHRIASHLWRGGREDLARFLQMRNSEVFGVDIHPGAKMGRGIMIDHAHSIVIGETAVVGDNVSMLHSVTLGGTGKVDGDRHPKIGDGVLIGAGAAVLGNIHVGHCSRIAAGSVVVKEVPPCTTVAGVPAKIIGDAGCETPSTEMAQGLCGCSDEG